MSKLVVSAIDKKYRPEKRGKENDITEAEHERVHRDHRHSKKKPTQIWETRVIKKREQPSKAVNGWAEARWTAEKTSLENLGLTEIFPKTA